MGFQKIKNFLARHVRLISVGAFFILALIIGLMTYGDYGGSYDDANNQSFGDKTLKVYSNALAGNFDACALKNNYCNNPHAQIHGPLFETAISVIQKMSSSVNPWDILQIRHLMVFLFFFAGLYVFYLLCLLFFKDWRIALLGCAFLFLSPRIFADSFYNSVDIGALVAMIISSYSLAVMVKNGGRLWRVLVHTAVSAAGIAVRSVTIIVPLATIVWYAYSIATAKTADRTKLFERLGIYLGVTAFLTVCFIPTLWQSPAVILQHLLLTTTFQVSVANLYLGSVIAATQLPWHYNLVWIAVTTPPLYLALFLAGLVASAGDLIRAIKQRHISFDSGARIYALSIILGPIIMVIVLHTSLYNGWRHLFFIYPALIFIALDGLLAVLRSASRAFVKWAVLAVVAVSLIATTATMLRIYPYEYLYFNSLYHRDVRAPDFDTDYWGLSYRNALLYLLAMDDSQTITVLFSDGPRNRNMTTLLSPAEQSRIIFSTAMLPARYLITNYYPLKVGRAIHYDSDMRKAFYSFNVDDVPVFSIIRLDDTSTTPSR